MSGQSQFVDTCIINLRVFESDVKGFTASSSSTTQCAFISRTLAVLIKVSSPLMVVFLTLLVITHSDTYSSYSLLANQSSSNDFHELKKFYKKTGRKLQFDAKEPVGFDKTKVECYSCQLDRAFLLKEWHNKGIKILVTRDEKCLSGPVTQKMNRRTMLSWLATVQVQTQSAVKGKGNCCKSSAGLYLETPKDITGTTSPTTMGIKHMTGNKAYLAEYQDFNVTPIAFGGSKGYKNCKGDQEEIQNAPELHNHIELLRKKEHDPLYEAAI
ncbi:hypothetical protein Tco_0499984 [Tanacetum coccineum]